MAATTVATTDREIDERILAQVQCILHSETLRSSEVLRRLLKFLADKTLSGEADVLKEYTVAIDALHKPATYDPKHDSTVRIQVCRLRQKLTEYYRGEGKDDLVVVDLPKGRFKLSFEIRQDVLHNIPPTAKTGVEPRTIWLAVLMSLALVVSLAWGEYLTMKLRRIDAKTPAAAAEPRLDPTWTPELQALWRPFVANHPLILGIADPLFMKLRRGDGSDYYYRDKSFDKWAELTDTPGAIGLRKLMHNPAAQPSRYYTPVADVYAAFMIGRLLATRQQNVSLVRISELSWHELADNNILFFGKQAFFNTQRQWMPIRPQLVPAAGGIENLNPVSGEPKLFSDRYSTAPSEEGEIYALVSHLPGPLGDGDIESFLSNRAVGYVGAVQLFTNPRSARTLVAKLRKPSGEFPRYYQVVLRVRFKDEVPTETSFVLGRDLSP